MGTRKKENDAGLKMTRIDWVVLLALIVLVLCLGYYGSERLHNLPRAQSQEGLFLLRS